MGGEYHNLCNSAFFKSTLFFQKTFSLGLPHPQRLWAVGMRLHWDQSHSQRKFEELDLETFLKKAL